MEKIKRSCFLFLLGLVLASSGFGQNKKYLVLLKDKTGTPFETSKPAAFLSQRAIQRRVNQGISIQARDLPLSPSYLQQIKATGAKIWYSSKWLNAVMIESDLATLKKVQALPFVRGLDGNYALNDVQIKSIRSGKMESTASPESYGNSLAQISMLGADKMHENGFRGEGMMIAVFDGGFLGADKAPFFKHIYDEKRLVSTFDFVNNRNYVYDDASHGTSVWSAIGAYSPGSLIGTAFKASFVLCKTEDDYSETRTEEANWLIAAEYADSLGVDVINSSLGYYDFDDPATNYTYLQMNGRSTLITRAADWCAGVGMIVVSAAGNEGSKPWKYISAPADADSILAIGAVDKNKNPASFTSRGPSADGRVKPDVAAVGLATTVGGASGIVGAGNGTSFASPLIAGLVASFWQAFPYLTNMQVMDYIRKSGSKYASPDTYVGYGIPDFARAVSLVPPRVSDGKVLLYPNPSSEQKLRVEFMPKHDGEAFKVSLYNSQGTLLFENTITGRTAYLSIDNQSLTAGVYVLKFQGFTTSYTVKWVKY